jgi:hypothetical protein
LEDGATSQKVPEEIHLESLPSASPELQPSERLWPLTNEGAANLFFEEIEDLEEALVERCVALCAQPEIIRSYTHYHWWPETHEKHPCSPGFGIGDLLKSLFMRLSGAEGGSLLCHSCFVQRDLGSDPAAFPNRDLYAEVTAQKG